jgi:hypothetical protein
LRGTRRYGARKNCRTVRTRNSGRYRIRVELHCIALHGRSIVPARPATNHPSAATYCCYSSPHMHPCRPPRRSCFHPYARCLLARHKHVHLIIPLFAYSWPSPSQLLDDSYTEHTHSVSPAPTAIRTYNRRSTATAVDAETRSMTSRRARASQDVRAVCVWSAETE